METWIPLVTHLLEPEVLVCWGDDLLICKDVLNHPLHPRIGETIHYLLICGAVLEPLPVHPRIGRAGCHLLNCGEVLEPLPFHPLPKSVHRSWIGKSQASRHRLQEVLVV
jgi:hypothetical protein